MELKIEVITNTTKEKSLGVTPPRGCIPQLTRSSDAVVNPSKLNIDCMQWNSDEILT